MKKFVSVLLVAMLVVASMCFTAFAAEAGETVKIPVTVNGPVGAFKVQVQSTDVLTVVDIHDDSATINKDKGIVVWSNAENVDSYTFYVTVKIADDAAVGSHYLDVSVKEATMKVDVDNDTDGVLDGWMEFEGSASGSIEIKEATTEPEDTTAPDTTEPEDTTVPDTTEPEKDDVPQTGDITILFCTSALILLAAVSTTVVILKRRAVR